MKVLATVDESTYDEQDGNTVDDDHPIAWCSNFDGGRSWYTGMGHTAASFSEANFRTHLLGGLRTAAAVGGDCGDERDMPPTAADFEKVTLNDDTNAPMEIDIAQDGRVFYIELDGRVQLWRPDGTTTTLTTIPVTLSHENGLLGIHLAPDFETSRHIYLAYSALPDAAGINRLSRFTLNAAGDSLGEEQIIYTWQHQRQECCHTGGSVDFGPDGNIYLSTGDNTNPFAHSFNPTDERPGPPDLGRPAHVGQHERRGMPTSCCRHPRTRKSSVPTRTPTAKSRWADRRSLCPGRRVKTGSSSSISRSVSVSIGSTSTSRTSTPRWRRRCHR